MYFLGIKHPVVDAETRIRQPFGINAVTESVRFGAQHLRTLIVYKRQGCIHLEAIAQAIRNVKIQGMRINIDRIAQFFAVGIVATASGLAQRLLLLTYKVPPGMKIAIGTSNLKIALVEVVGIGAGIGATHHGAAHLPNGYTALGG